MRTNLLGLAVAASLVLALASCDEDDDGPSGPPADPHENNDTRTTATDFTLGARVWLSDHLSWPGVQSDDDWYRITVPAGKLLVSIDCSFTNAEGNIDIALVNVGDSVLTSKTGNEDGHSIAYEVSAAGDYWIRVYGADAGNTYDLRWQAIDVDATYDPLTQDEPAVTYAWVNITSTGTSLPLADNETSSAISLGFNFSFYGVSYADVYVNSNGFISFDTPEDTGATQRLLPDPSFTTALIAAFWTDLDPSSGGTIYYETLGSSPNQTFVVTYDNVIVAGTSETITTQIILHETTNEILVNGQAYPPTALTYTQGVQNGAGTIASFIAGRNDFNAVVPDEASVLF